MLYNLLFLSVPLFLIFWKFFNYKSCANTKNKQKSEKKKALKRAKKLGLIVYERKNFQPKLRNKQQIYQLYVIEGKQKK